MENLNRIYQLDKPLIQQYWLYLGAVMRGDFGPSFILRDFSVGELFARGLPVSMTLGGLALSFAIIVGGTLGSIAAMRQNSTVDYFVTGIGALGLTIPNFVVAPIFQIVFGLTLAWLPVAGWANGNLRNLILPVLVLALPQIAVDLAHDPRGHDREPALEPYPHPALPRACPPRVVVVHALRGAALPVVSYLGPAAAALLTGSVVVETIFGLPGIGRYFVEGALNRDYTLVMGTVVVMAVFVLLFNLVVDILYALIDPRIRYE